MTISDPLVIVTCDGCNDDIEIDLTPLAGNAYDMRNVNRALERMGWSTEWDKHYCGECTSVNEEEDHNEQDA